MNSVVARELLERWDRDGKVTLLEHKRKTKALFFETLSKRQFALQVGDLEREGKKSKPAMKTRVVFEANPCDGTVDWDEAKTIPGVEFQDDQLQSTAFTRNTSHLQPGDQKSAFVKTEEALERLIGWYGGGAAELSPVVDTAEVDPATETEETRARRLCQSAFRADLLKRWEGKCALTGVDMSEVLRASHIKPWRDSNHDERRDVNNGLLLAVHIDILFDSRLLSFADDGTVMLSDRVSPKIRTEFNLDRDLRIVGLSHENRRYLELHRNLYFDDISG